MDRKQKKQLEEAIEAGKQILDSCFESKTKDGKNIPVYCVGGIETSIEYDYKDAMQTLLSLASKYLKEEIRELATEEEIQNKIIAYVIAHGNCSEDWHKKFSDIVNGIAKALVGKIAKK